MHRASIPVAKNQEFIGLTLRVQGIDANVAWILFEGWPPSATVAIFQTAGLLTIEKDHEFHVTGVNDDIDEDNVAQWWRWWWCWWWWWWWWWWRWRWRWERNWTKMTNGKDTLQLPPSKSWYSNDATQGHGHVWVPRCRVHSDHWAPGRLSTKRTWQAATEPFPEPVEHVGPGCRMQLQGGYKSYLAAASDSRQLSEMWKHESLSLTNGIKISVDSQFICHSFVAAEIIHLTITSYILWPGCEQMLKRPNQPSTSYFTKCHHEIWCWRMSKLALACGGSMICTCLIPILFAKKDRTISWNFQMIYQKYQCLPPCHQQVKLNAWTRPITASSIYGRSNWKHGVKQYHNLSQVILGTIRKTQGWTCGCRYVLWQFVKAVCCWNRTWCVKAMACWMPLNDHRELLICSIPGDGPRRSKWIKNATWSRETLKQERKKLAKWLCSSLLNFKLC